MIKNIMVGDGDAKFPAEKYDGIYSVAMKPEDLLSYIKAYGELPKDLNTIDRLSFLPLLGWKQTSFRLVYIYEKGDDEIYHTADSCMFYINDEYCTIDDVLKFVGLM